MPAGARGRGGKLARSGERWTRGRRRNRRGVLHTRCRRWRPDPVAWWPDPVAPTRSGGGAGEVPPLSSSTGAPLPRAPPPARRIDGRANGGSRGPLPAACRVSGVRGRRIRLATAGAGRGGGPPLPAAPRSGRGGGRTWRRRQAQIQP
ncbi:hypothetical protein PVAP13_2KG435205 [Panicum virgatum]|uniref:Uncharacterized protein n=1 Tax=Panicum virgatum TaxID=38727 RepID=A0A8T0W874_PANVG|nr:hypothetical protein PVAP13_2KG435205 [Panicum virgatum]